MHSWECVQLLGEHLASGCTMGRKVNWQRYCDVLGNVLLGKFRSCHSCECQFDTCHLPKHCCRPHPFMEMVFAGGCGLFQQDTKNGSGTTRHWLGLQIPQILIQLSIYVMCWTNKSLIGINNKKIIIKMFYVKDFHKT